VISYSLHTADGTCVCFAHTQVPPRVGEEVEAYPLAGKETFTWRIVRVIHQPLGIKLIVEKAQ